MKTEIRVTIILFYKNKVIMVCKVTFKELYDSNEACESIHTCFEL